MALSNTSPHTFRPLQSILLIVASVIFLPVSLLALFYNYAALILCPQNGLRRHVKRSIRFKSRKVIVTGISTPMGLRVARALYHTGHNVVGVQEGGRTIINHARWSKAVSRVYSIPLVTGSEANEKYAERLFRVIVKERASIWVDCSDNESISAQAYAKSVVEDRSACVCLVPTPDQIQQFETSYGFSQLAQQLGLPNRESHAISSRNDIYNVLNKSNDKKYMLSSSNSTSGPAMRTILPRRTVSQTYTDLARLKVSKSTPWTLEHYVDGLPQFTACAVIVRGTLKAFAASFTAGNGNFKAVSVQSGLRDAMKQYMESFAEAVGSTLSSHLTMEFCLDEKATHSGVVQQILPLGGRLVPHESLLLFDGKKGSIDLTKAYLATVSSATTELESYTGLPYFNSTSDITVPAESDVGVYSVNNDLKNLLVGPALQLMTLRSSILAVLRTWVMFLHHLVAWQEALYEFGDPLPLFWYTHVSTPCHLLWELAQQARSQLSSSYGRRFGGKHVRREVLNGTRG